MTTPQQLAPDTTKLSIEKVATGESCFNNGDLEGAMRAFREALALDPENVVANSNLGVALWMTNDQRGALTYLNRAHALDPDDKVALANLAEVYTALQQEPEALRLYLDYVNRHPDETEIRDILNALHPDKANSGGDSLQHQLTEQADELENRGKTRDALSLLEAALVVSDNPLEIHRRIARSCLEAGQEGKAIEHLTKAFHLDPLDKPLTLKLTGLLFSRNMHDVATHICETYLSLKPEDDDIEASLERARAPAAKRASAGQEQPASELLSARVPEMNNALGALTELGVDIRAILDVGVLHGTPPLMKTFPDLKHYLFEPIDSHFDSIRTNYRNLDHHLFHVALSSSDGEVWLNHLCNDGSGRITHSQIAKTPGSTDKDPRFLRSKRVPMARLDTLMSGMDVAAPYLLKIDVDGQEISVLEGARETLKNASVVIIEATAPTVVERTNFLAREGFVLFDIVDIVYYAGVLYQMDIIFVRKELIDGNKRLRPLGVGSFKPGQWHGISDKWFSRNAAGASCNR